MSLLEVKNLSFSYENNVQVFEKINFTVNMGDCLAIKGPNGSGKSTIAKLLVGILKPASGYVFFKSRDIAEFELADIGEKIGYVMQNPERQLFLSTVEDDMAFALKHKGLRDKDIERKINKMLNFFGLAHCRKKPPFILSRGEQQRLVIASVLVLEPKVLLLDEPTTGLDPLRKKKLELMLTDLYYNGTTLIIIGHDHKFLKGLFNRKLYIVNNSIQEEVL